MKRYLLFTGNQYYPSGGWSDFKGSFDTVEEALIETRGDWWHIVDSEIGTVVIFG
jgi:hypothetical protein